MVLKSPRKKNNDQKSQYTNNVHRVDASVVRYNANVAVYHIRHLGCTRRQSQPIFVGRLHWLCANVVRCLLYYGSV